VVEVAEEHGELFAGAARLHTERLDAAEHLLAIEQLGEFVGAGAMFELLLGGDLRVDNAAGGNEAIHAPARVEIRAGVGLDPMARAVLGANDFARPHGVAGLELRHVGGALGAIAFLDKIGGETTHAFADRIAEGGGNRGRDPLDGAAADAGDDVGGIFGEQAVAFLGSGEAFGRKVTLGDIAPGPDEFVVDANGADVETALLPVDLVGEGVVVDHKRLAGFVRVAGHGHERARVVGREKLEQTAAEERLAVEVIVFRRRGVRFADGEVGDLAAGVATRRDEQVRIEEGIEDIAGSGPG